MSESVKKCPFCGEEIEEGVVKCPFCNESLETKKQKLLRVSKEFVAKLKQVKFPELKINKLFFCILIGIFVVLVLLFSILSYENNTVKDVFGISNLSTVEMPSDVIDSVVTDEKVMKKYFEQLHLQSNKDEVFKIFLKRLDDSCDRFAEIMELWDLYYYHDGRAYDMLDSYGYVVIKNIKLVRTKDGSLTISSPKAPFYKLTGNGEGGYNTSGKYEYLEETYSKYLSNEYKDYLKLLTMEEKYLEGGSYTMDGALNITKDELVNWIMAWQKFRQKYPKFFANNENVQYKLKMYTRDLLTDAYAWNYGDESLYPEARAAIQKFVDISDKTMPEYKIVNKCNDVLKKHKYKINDEFFSCVEEEYGDIESHT